jgi:hypothetical protein
VPARNLEVVMVIGIVVAVGVALMGLCTYHVVRKWRGSRG